MLAAAARRKRAGWPLFAAGTLACVLGAAVWQPGVANAAKPKKKPPVKGAPAEPEVVPAPEPAKPVAPGKPAADKPGESKPEPAKPEVVAPAPAKPEPAAPAEPPGKKAVSLETPPAVAAKKPAGKSIWEGFFFTFGAGYATSGGQSGPAVPDVEGTVFIGTAEFKKTIQLHSAANYSALVTSDVGAGPAVTLQFGYNILGYASIWLDIAGHGDLSTDKKNLSGGGGVSLAAGIHPLRFVRPDMPVDFKLYAGYTPIEVLAYNENQVQVEYKAKAWIGSAIPFGLHTEWKPNPDGGFALGFDLRMTKASYNQWYYNWDREELSRPDPPVTTLRIEPRLTLAAHF